MLTLVLVMAALFIGFRWGYNTCVSHVDKDVQDILNENPIEYRAYRAHVTCSCGIGKYIEVETGEDIPNPWYCPSCVEDQA